LKIEYKAEKGKDVKRKCTTPCPSDHRGGNGFKVMVGSFGCLFCQYHKGNSQNEGGGDVECSAGEDGHDR